MAFGLDSINLSIPARTLQCQGQAFLLRVFCGCHKSVCKPNASLQELLSHMTLPTGMATVGLCSGCRACVFWPIGASTTKTCLRSLGGGRPDANAFSVPMVKCSGPSSRPSATAHAMAPLITHGHESRTLSISMWRRLRMVCVGWGG